MELDDPRIETLSNYWVEHYFNYQPSGKFIANPPGEGNVYYKLEPQECDRLAWLAIRFLEEQGNIVTTLKDELDSVEG